MTKFYNTNERYGDSGPFEAESKDALADEMSDKFVEWATDEYTMLAWTGNIGDDVEMDDFIRERTSEMRTEFITGLEEA